MAFILNPTLSELELLAAICDELKIRYKKTDASLKLLGDKIKARLLKNHEAGKHTLLIIDEAQHLQPAVLEQLRLLTNLETEQAKLLQRVFGETGEAAVHGWLAVNQALGNTRPTGTN